MRGSGGLSTTFLSRPRQTEGFVMRRLSLRQPLAFAVFVTAVFALGMLVWVLTIPDSATTLEIVRWKLFGLDATRVLIPVIFLPLRSAVAQGRVHAASDPVQHRPISAPVADSSDAAPVRRQRSMSPIHGTSRSSS